MNRFPLFRCLVFYILGILLANKLACTTALIHLLCTASGFVLTCFFFHIKRQAYNALIPIGFFLFGFLHYTLQMPTTIPYEWHETAPKTIHIQAEILETGKQKTNSYQVKAKLIATSLPKVPLSNILLEFKSSPTPEIGDYIQLEGKLIPFQSTALPEQFDYVAYLKSQGIGYKFKVNHWTLLPHKHRFSLKIFAAKLQQKLFKKLEKKLKEKDTLGLAAAVLLGHKDALDSSLKKAFQQAGAIHMLAVSGMHTGILYMVLCFLFRINSGTGKWQLFKKFLVLLLLWFFALLTGFSPGVIRACTMFSLIVFSGIIKRENELFHQICLACFLMLLYNSHWLFDLGFQLSYAALTGIALLQKPLADCFPSKYNFIKHIVSLLSVSLSAQFACLPFILYYFHSFPSYFLLSNLLLLPFLPLLVYGGILILLLDLFSISIPAVISSYEFILSYFNKAIVYIASLPLSYTKAIYPSLWQTLALSIFLGIMAYAFVQKKFRFVKYALCALLYIQSEELFEKWRMEHGKYLFQHNNQSRSFYFISKRIAYAKTETTNAYEQKQIHQFFQKKHITEIVSFHHPKQENTSQMIIDNYRFLWFKDSLSFKADIAAKKTILILSENPRITSTILMKLKPIMVLADRSNHTQSIDEWKQESEKWGIPFYNCKENYLWMPLDE